MQPFGAVGQTPFQPARTFVKLADQDESFIGRCIDLGSEADDASIEIVDGKKTVLGRSYRLHDTSLWVESDL